MSILAGNMYTSGSTYGKGAAPLADSGVESMHEFSIPAVGAHRGFIRLVINAL